MTLEWLNFRLHFDLWFRIRNPVHTSWAKSSLTDLEAHWSNNQLSIAPIILYYFHIQTLHRLLKPFIEHWRGVWLTKSVSWLFQMKGKHISGKTLYSARGTLNWIHCQNFLCSALYRLKLFLDKYYWMLKILGVSFYQVDKNKFYLFLLSTLSYTDNVSWWYKFLNIQVLLYAFALLWSGHKSCIMSYIGISGKLIKRFCIYDEGFCCLIAYSSGNYDRREIVPGAKNMFLLRCNCCWNIVSRHLFVFSKCEIFLMGSFRYLVCKQPKSVTVFCCLLCLAGLVGFWSGLPLEF